MDLWGQSLLAIFGPGSLWAVSSPAVFGPSVPLLTVIGAQKENAALAVARAYSCCR